MKTNLQNVIDRIIIWAFGIITLLLVALDVFYNVGFAGRRYFLVANGILLIIGLAILAGLYFLFRYIRVPEFIHKNIRVFEGLVFTVFFIFQLVITYCSYSYPSWDPGLMWANAMIYRGGQGLDLTYFSTYPNNILLFNYELVVQKLAASLPLNIFSDGLFLPLIINCIISSVTGILTYKIIKAQAGLRMAWFVWTLYTILLGTSGWLGICYSDSLALLFPILTYYIVSQYKKPVRFVFAGFVAVIGAFIKPQTIIMLIAIVIYGIFRAEAFRKKLLNLALILIGLALGYVLSLGLRYNTFDLDKEASFSLTHYIMMGLNDYGEYSASDVDYSMSFTDKSERSQANLEVAKERLHAMGFSGFISHSLKKAFYSYSDGAFGYYGVEKSGFWDSERYTEGSLAALCTSIIRGGGTLYNLASALRQAVWLALLLFAGLLPFRTFCSKKHNICDLSGISIPALALIGLFLFLMIFEANSRYLFAYLPVYLLLFPLGTGNSVTIVRPF